MGALVGAGEECVFPIERDGAHGPLDRIGVELDAAVAQEDSQALKRVAGVSGDEGVPTWLRPSQSFSRLSLTRRSVPRSISASSSES
jgi:hypothetical protein